MSLLLVRIAAGFVCLVAALPAAAALLQLEAEFGIHTPSFYTTLDGSRVELPGLESGAPVPVFVSSGSGGFTVPAALFSGTVSPPRELFTGVPLLGSASIDLVNRAGALTAAGGPGGGFGGSFDFDGVWRNGLLNGLVNISIPGSVIGAPGLVEVGAASLRVTVTGHLWTTGGAVITGLSDPTPSGFANTEVLSGFDGRGADHIGTLQLVAPVRVLSNAIIPQAAFAIATLRFVPEPGTLVLIAAAIASLAAVGRSRT